jgi:hypothetical protein
MMRILLFGSRSHRSIRALDLFGRRCYNKAAGAPNQHALGLGATLYTGPLALVSCDRLTSKREEQAL